MTVEEQIVVVRAALVVAFGVRDGKTPALRLAFLVGVSAGAHQLVARALEHDEVVRVVHDSHHVCVRVRNAVFHRNLLHN